MEYNTSEFSQAPITHGILSDEKIIASYRSPVYVSDDVDLIAYLKVIWKYKWFIFLLTTLTIVGTFYFTKSLPKIYTSTVSVILPQEDGSNSSISAMLGGLGFGDLAAGNSTAELIVEVLKSRRMAEQITREYNLMRYYDGTITPTNISKILGKENIDTLAVFAMMNKKGYIDRDGKAPPAIDSTSEGFSLKLDGKYSQLEHKLTHLYKKEHHIIKEITAVENLMKNTKIESTKSGLIKVMIADESPTMAARIANSYIAEMDNMNEELQITTKKPMLKVLDKAIIPSRKSKPSVSANVAVAGVMSLFGAIFLSFFAQFFIDNLKRNKT